MSLTQKLEICKQTRKIAAGSLAKVLKQVLKSDESVSEARFRDIWLKELRLHPEIFPDGWYVPPPSGMGILFGKDTETPNRISYKSLRPEDMWPKDLINLDKENGLAYLFASSINKEFGIIGDFGLTIYLGKNTKIQEHFKKVLNITKQVFYYAQVGMKFSDIAKYCAKLCKENNLVNNVASTTDPTGVNIGHTIPSTDRDWTEDEKEILKSENSKTINDLISKRRIFLNETEDTVLKEGMAITIEPRLIDPTDPSTPMSSFHTIAIFNSGRNELVTGFDEIFKLTQMNYLF